MPNLCSLVISDRDIQEFGGFPLHPVCVFFFFFFVVAPATHVELSAWSAPRTAGPDSHGQCVKPTERKTTGPFAQQGQHFKTPLQTSFAISASGRRNYKKVQEILIGEVLF